LAVLTGVRAFGSSAEVRSLGPYMGEASGAAVLVDVPTRRLIAVHGEAMAGCFLAPPGSTLKALVLSALLRSGKLTSNFSLPCPGQLRIGGRSFTCSHPVLGMPIRVDTALAYSCNCFVAHAAARFAAGELARELTAVGLASRTGLIGDAEAGGRIQPASAPDAIRLQSLGEAGVLVTTAGLAMAYRRIALAQMTPIIAGLEGAIEFGTARAGRVEGADIAGKTGSVRTADGARIAWFAGFMPARDARSAIAVMVAGRSGGADAAPIAGRILDAYRKRRI